MLRSVAINDRQVYYFCCMYLHSSHLLIKLYKDKPSRIGIKYTYGFQALKPYEELVRKFAGHTFSMKLEPQQKQISLRLRSDQSGEVIVYKALHYKAEELKNLMQQGYSGMPLEFVHIYTEANVTLIAKPFKQQQFFSISAFEIVGINEFY